MERITDATQAAVNSLGTLLDDKGVDDVLRIMSIYLSLRQDLGGHKQSLICMACKRIMLKVIVEDVAKPLSSN